MNITCFLGRIAMLVCVLSLAFSTSVAQSVKDDLKEAQFLFGMERYVQAAPYYEKVVQAEPNNAKHLYELGVCYENMLLYHKAQDKLEAAYAIDNEVDNEFHYWYGEVLHHIHDFDKATAEYENYISTLGHRDSRIENAKLHIKQIAIAKDLLQKPTNHMIENLGEFLNSGLGEHSPIISMDESRLIFTQMIHKKGYGLEEQFEQIVESHKDDAGNWTDPEPLEGCLGENGHNACIQLFDKDQKMLIYRPDGGGDLFVSELSGTTWGEAKPLKGINTKHHEADGSMTQDGKTLYFTTDRQSRDGHLDIVYSTLQEDGNWSDPISMSSINTQYDEIAPFITNNGKTLYFCSNNEQSMGEFDVFKTELEADGQWSNPFNMGSPINTTENDVYYHTNASQDMGFLASYRVEGFGLMDIYKVVEIPEVTCHITIKDAEGNIISEPGFKAEYKTIEDQWRESSGQQGFANGVAQFPLLAHNIYEIKVFGEDKYWVTKQIDLGMHPDRATMEHLEFQIDYVKKDPIAVASIADPKEDERDILVPNTQGELVVYFDYNSGEPDKKSVEKLSNLVTKLKGKKSTIKAVGHTDSIGSNGFNQKLSKTRAQAVINHLKEKGLSTVSVSSKGMGETQPAESNDSEKGRSLNRRVVISYDSK